MTDEDKENRANFNRRKNKIIRNLMIEGAGYITAHLSRLTDGEWDEYDIARRRWGNTTEPYIEAVRRLMRTFQKHYLFFKTDQYFSPSKKNQGKFEDKYVSIDKQKQGKSDTLSEMRDTGLISSEAEERAQLAENAVHQKRISNPRSMIPK